MAKTQFFDFIARGGELITSKSGKGYMKFYTCEEEYILIKVDFAKLRGQACKSGTDYCIRCRPAVYEGVPYFQFEVVSEVVL